MTCSPPSLSSVVGSSPSDVRDDSDGLQGPGVGESGGRVLPGSADARRRHRFEDDDLQGVGVSARPKLKRMRRPTGLYELWRSITDPLEWEREIETTFDVPRPLFNKHIADLRSDYSDAEITEGFREFVRQVQAGHIGLVGKPAWLVFYSRRLSLVKREQTVAFSEDIEEVPWLPPDEEVLWWDIDE